MSASADAACCARVASSRAQAALVLHRILSHRKRCVHRLGMDEELRGRTRSDAFWGAALHTDLVWCGHLRIGPVVLASDPQRELADEVTVANADRLDQNSRP